MTTLSTSSLTSATDCPAGIDPRGPRFAAAITTVVLSAALVLASPVLLALQAVVFAIGVLRRPRPPALRTAVQAPRPPAPGRPGVPGGPGAPRGSRRPAGWRSAWSGSSGFALGAQWLALGAIGFALAAAFLNAAFDFCIGCEIYLRAQRLRRS